MLCLKQMALIELEALRATILSERAEEPDAAERSRLSLLLWVVQCVMVDRSTAPINPVKNGRYN